MAARAPPLAGRPPFATDEPDDIYEDRQAPRRRVQQPGQQNNNARDSTYQAWDTYLQDDQNRNSGAGGIGMGLMNGDLNDSDDDEPPMKQPMKGNAVAEKNKALFDAATSGQQQSPISKPTPAAHAPSRSPPANQPPMYPQQREIAQPQPRPAPGQRPAAAALRVDVPSPSMPIPRAPVPAFMQAPSEPAGSLNPHPLNAPSTPITPVFARPSFQEKRDVKFKDDAILRGNSEETLLARGTQKGEEFWRRFSFVAKEAPKQDKSNWLKRHQGGYKRMNCCVWTISIILLAAIGGAVGLGWYLTHGKPSTLPVAVGGSESRGVPTGTETSTEEHHDVASSTSRVVIAPTLAASKRAFGEPCPEHTTMLPVPVPRRAIDAHARARKNRMVIEDLD